MSENGRAECTQGLTCVIIHKEKQAPSKEVLEIMSTVQQSNGCFHESEHALTSNVQAEMFTSLVEEKIRIPLRYY